MMPLAWSSGMLWPELSPAAQTLLRAGYGLLLLAFLLITLPHGRRFFLSERWGGYAQASRGVDALQNPVVYPLLMASWLLAAGLLVVGWGSWWPSLWNLLLCRYFFVRMRWRGVARGMGAPGFMTYWLAAAVFLLELTASVAPSAHRLALRGLSEELRNGIRPGQSRVGILVAPLCRGAARPLDHLDAESARLGDRGGGRPAHAPPRHPIPGCAPDHRQLRLHRHPHSLGSSVRDGDAGRHPVLSPGQRRRSAGRAPGGARRRAPPPGEHRALAAPRHRPEHRALGLPDPPPAGPCRALLQLLRARHAAASSAARPRALHQLLRHHHLARLLRGRGQLLHPHPLRAGSGRPPNPDQSLRLEGRPALCACLRVGNGDEPLHHLEVLSEQCRALPRPAAPLCPDRAPSG